MNYFLWIPSPEAPSGTRLSEWKSGADGAPNWVSVAKKPPRGLLVQHCYFNLLHMDLDMIDARISLSTIDGGLDARAAKDAVASSILSALRDGHGICDVQRFVRDAPASDDDRDCMEAPLTLGELRAIYPKQTMRAEINRRPAVELTHEANAIIVNSNHSHPRSQVPHR